MPNKPSIKTLLKTRLLAENQKEKLHTSLVLLNENNKLTLFEIGLLTALERERKMNEWKQMPDKK